MKTSNYILIGFLTFVAFSLLGWHIDSKIYEEEYDKKRKARMEFYRARTLLEKNNDSPDRQAEFTEKAKEYFKYYNKYHYDFFSAASILNNQFKMFKDTSNLVPAKKWIHKAYELNPKDRQVNLVYGEVLENLGLHEDANQYFDNVKKLDSINGIKYVEYKNDAGETIKLRRNVK
ncbi:M48 family metallopeptidase [Seonamhaeicola sp. ML3]|uniref:tetratricopeptide repeat protein n=1 Tax=Seonamhaeicola sp. ML3 TaxID=2937786 RepID=UPI00200FB56B|nr:hypothetical protein [Seonamhaeicola sp. ML3]